MMLHRIVFLDDDHVIRIARLAMSEMNMQDRAWLEDFAAPEPFAFDRLDRGARGLRAADGCVVRLADPDEPTAGAEVIVFRRGQVDRALMDRNPELKFVQRLGAGTDAIDLASAAERGITVSCLPRQTLAYTAEHAVLLMLALRKRLLAADAAVRAWSGDPSAVSAGTAVAYNWVGLSGVRGLSGATVGLIGLGEVGRLVARLARAFGARVVYTGRQPLAPEREAELGVSYLTLHDLLGSADLVSLHAANLPENRHMVGRDQIAAMARHAFFINTSRGRLVDEDALYDALIDRRIAGAGLDVHAHEPRPGADRFCALDNVILTPHLAGGSRLGVLDELDLIFDNLRAVLGGHAPVHGVVPLGSLP